jgi:hypothetical protein
MPARLFLSSGDLMADRRFEFARDLQLKGDLPADLLMQAIELAPNFTSVGSRSPISANSSASMMRHSRRFKRPRPAMPMTATAPDCD